MNVDQSVYSDELARLGRALRMAREDLRMSPDQVAALLGVNASTIYKIERGRWNVSVGYLISLAKIYGLSLEFVYPNGDILEETKKNEAIVWSSRF